MKRITLIIITIAFFFQCSSDSILDKVEEQAYPEYTLKMQVLNSGLPSSGGTVTIEGTASVPSNKTHIVAATKHISQTFSIDSSGWVTMSVFEGSYVTTFYDSGGVSFGTAVVTIARSNSSDSNSTAKLNINSSTGSASVDSVSLDRTVNDGSSSSDSTSAIAVPTVSVFKPVNMASHPASDTSIVITFSEPMDIATLSQTNFWVESGWTGCDKSAIVTPNTGPTPSNSDTTFTLTFGPAWTDGAQYSTCVSPDVKDVNDGQTMGTLAMAQWTADDWPNIIGSDLAVDNSYIDIHFDEPVYDNTMAGAVQQSFFSLTFNQNTGTATAASITSITNTSGGGLSGGESSIRLLLSITGTVSGTETIEVNALGSVIYNASGNAASVTETTGVKLLNP